MTLSDLKIRNAKPKNKPYKLFDGGGLFIIVNKSGSKLWRIKYRLLGKERLFSAGEYPAVSAADARQLRTEVKRLIGQGIDPVQHRRSTKFRRIEAGQNTFEAVARRWLEIKRIEPSHKARSLRRLELYAFPKLGFRPIHEIDTIELVTCLEAIERKGILETAHRIKQLLQQVFRYAVRRGLITHNPAGDLRDILTFPQTQHFACIKPAELPTLLHSIETYTGDVLTRRAMKLLVYTFVRTGELIGAAWDEIDWNRAEWRIPAKRMKMRRDHVVPLARQTLALLEEIRELTGRQKFVFHSPANKSGHLSNGAILSALRRMGYAGKMTGHGFRALASTILNEQRKYHADVIERQLAHTERNEVRAAYNRADYLLERKKMMQGWSDYIDAVRTDKRVIKGLFLKVRAQAQS